MKVKELLEELRENQNKALLFEYKQGSYAGTNYHITEVKNVDVKSVDCGGRSNQWKETIIQLWESPSEKGKKDYMTVEKALAIFDRVNSINPLWLETEAKIEYSNAEFHTAILDIHNISVTSSKVIIHLFVTETLCKALETCGVLVEEISENNTKEEACCSPQSGCC